MKLGRTPLALQDLRAIVTRGPRLELDPACLPELEAAVATIERIVEKGDPAYGINTGFGKLAQTKIERAELAHLQENIVLSHAAGVGPPLADDVVRLVIALKVASLARGRSGVRKGTIEKLLALNNDDRLPKIPSKGSVGASGDLAPLAHLAMALMPMTFAPKEGLALLNGTQVSTALALSGLFAIESVFAAAVVSGALSVDAAMGSDTPFDPRIHEVRGHAGQIAVAAAYRRLLAGSEIRASHLKGDDRVQDPYSLRCQPQVMGACLDIMRGASATLAVEANGVSDNPLVFPGSGEVLSGGNFHAEPVALAADTLALACAEIGALSERRIALLIDGAISRLPHFLVEHGGLNSGFMIAQVTAAALASENKTLAHPASVDSLPTSANQEDHVSMATFAARRLGDMADNTAGIVAVELLAAAQGVDFRKPRKTSPALQEAMAEIRARVPFYDKDRHFAPDIEAIKALVLAGAFNHHAAELLPSGG